MRGLLALLAFLIPRIVTSAAVERRTNGPCRREAWNDGGHEGGGHWNDNCHDYGHGQHGHGDKDGKEGMGGKGNKPGKGKGGKGGKGNKEDCVITRCDLSKQSCLDTVIDDIFNGAGDVIHDNIPAPNSGTITDMINNGVISIVNVTFPSWGDSLPALINGTDPATSMGANSTGGQMPVQGTNLNAPTVGDGIPNNVAVARPRPAGSIDRLIGKRYVENGVDYAVRMGSAAYNPDLVVPKDDPALHCEYSYEHVLGGGGTTSRGGLWALEGSVWGVAADVRQGGIGDCGLGASVMALLANVFVWTKYLPQMLVRTDPSLGDHMFTVAFKKEGSTHNVVIDDQLPVLQNLNFNCWPYLGFQPVRDAVEPGPLGNYPPTDVFFMPLLEKAFAKFFDNTPDWSPQAHLPLRNVSGYLGLTGTSPDKALAAITGGNPRSVWRSKPGFDGPLMAATVMCMTGKAPCVIDTGPHTLEGLGDSDGDGVIWLNPAGNAEQGFESGTTSGMVADDLNNKTFTVIDFDQLDDTGHSTAVTLVGMHAYAFDYQRTTKPPFTLPMEDWRIRLINPWGTNPLPWPGAVNPTGEWDNPGELTLSFRTFSQVIRAIYTVTDMPL